MWLLWDCHVPVGSRQARVNEVSPSVALGAQSRAALVPEATALRVSVPAGGVVVVVGAAVVVVVVTTGASLSVLVTLIVTSTTGS